MKGAGGSGGRVIFDRLASHSGEGGNTPSHFMLFNRDKLGDRMQPLARIQTYPISPHDRNEIKSYRISVPITNFSGMKWLLLFLFPPGLDASNSLLVSIHSPWWRGAWREKCHPRKHSTMTQPKIKLDICRSRLQSSDRWSHSVASKRD